MDINYTSMCYGMNVVYTSLGLSELLMLVNMFLGVEHIGIYLKLVSSRVMCEGVGLFSW